MPRPRHPGKRWLREVKHDGLRSDEKSKGRGEDNMPSADVALRFSAVFAVAGFIIMAASLFEIDRREKSSSETVTANFTEIEQRVRMLSEEIRILNDQYTSQINRNEQQLHSLDTQVQTLDSRLNELENRLGDRRR
jgi:peptidoglycan hydrolase CwlO-like protein